MKAPYIMKKTIALLLAALLAISLLAGCGSSQNVGGKIEPLPGNKETAGATEEATESTGADNEVALGRMEGGVYTNPYAGYGCKLDTSWQFLTAEELQEIPENLQEILSGTAAGDALEKYATITDVQAENVTELTTFNVLYQKLDANMKLASLTMSEEDVIESVLATKDQMIQSYAQAGVEVATMEKVTVTFLGEKHTALKTTSTRQGVAYYTLQIMDYHLGGDYSVTLTVGSFVEDKTADLLKMFYTV